MNYEYTITNFSPYPKWTHKSIGKNISDVIDAMIRVTAKATEFYASDIYYEIEALHFCVNNRLETDNVLLFREGGVNHYPVIDEQIVCEYLPQGQAWRLQYDPDTETALFRRVRLAENRLPLMNLQLAVS